MGKLPNPLRTCIWCHKKKREYKNFANVSTKPPIYREVCKKCEKQIRHRYGRNQHRMTLGEQITHIVKELHITEKEFSVIIEGGSIDTISATDEKWLRHLYKRLLSPC